MFCDHDPKPATRREALSRLGQGFGLTALAAMTQNAMAQTASDPKSVGVPGSVMKSEISCWCSDSQVNTGLSCSRNGPRWSSSGDAPRSTRAVAGNPVLDAWISGRSSAARLARVASGRLGSRTTSRDP